MIQPSAKQYRARLLAVMFLEGSCFFCVPIFVLPCSTALRSARCTVSFPSCALLIFAEPTHTLATATASVPPAQEHDRREKPSEQRDPRPSAGAHELRAGCRARGIYSLGKARAVAGGCWKGGRVVALISLCFLCGRNDVGRSLVCCVWWCVCVGQLNCRCCRCCASGHTRDCCGFYHFLRCDCFLQCGYKRYLVLPSTAVSHLAA